MKKRDAIIAFVALAMLLWLWPNVVHEPLHVLALRLQGSDGYIVHDWSFPPHPSTVRTAPVAGVLGGLFFLMLPSIVSMLLLIGVWLTRKSAALLSHVVLPVYLLFDLLVNIMKFGRPQSDFHFLVATPLVIWMPLAVAGFLFGMKT